jgi:hypothetical protein
VALVGGAGLQLTTMNRRVTSWLTLGCYSAIALLGQGLHAWIHDGCDEHEHSSTAAAVTPLVGYLADGAGARISDGTTDDDCCQHDAEHCAICQHHSLGQIFAATPPVQGAPEVCELLSDVAPEAVNCPALYTPAQPRAPPTV